MDSLVGRTARMAADSITLKGEPASEQLLAQLGPEWAGSKAAQASFNGKPHEACWMLVGDVVAAAYDNGEYGALYVSEFK